ncbi:alpha helicase [Deltaproteobacteria bacterium OttesenSCG-928-M10]|nr:alpha helicase [Deltaproteobacteria bacterium OttesenSCG-928-M10]
MNILDLLHQKGINPGRRRAGTKGGEYQMPCPRCGGRDRFHAWPDQGEGGTWWCRSCDKAGDLIEFLRFFDGLTFPEACARLGVERQRDYRRLPSPPRPAGPEAFAGVRRELPPEQWLTRAEKLALAAHDHLKMRYADPDDALIRWLYRRGLDITEVVIHRLGWLAGENGKPCLWRPRSAWGLPDIEERRGENKVVKKKLWIPRGLVIPTIVDGRVAALRVRRPEADRQEGGSPYYVVPGGPQLPMVSVAPRVRSAGPVKVWLVVESQLDAILAAASCVRNGLVLPVGAVAMLSNTGKPDPDLHLKLAAADRILVALDYDGPGQQGAAWWFKTYPRAIRWPVPEGKDPGEYFALGGDVHEWIKDGLEVS